MLIKIEKNVQKNTLKSWKYNFVICAPHSVSCAPLPHSFPLLLGIQWGQLRAAFAIFGVSLVQSFIRPTAVRIPRFECKWYMWAGKREERRKGGGQQQGGATHNRATRPELVCHLRRHQAQSLDQAQDRSCVVQMTYKNLIFNNTNQFKNHQRHKNSFAGA